MITQRLMKLGSWNLTLTDPSLKDEIDYFEHVVVIPGELRIPAVLSDASILSIARYVGIIRGKRVAGPAGGDDALELSGHGLSGWLGDEDGKGDIIEAARNYSVDTFANVLDRSGSTPYGLLRDAAGAQTAIHAGTLFSVAGTYTGNHRFIDQRSAIRYVVDVFGAEYRVNPDFTLDAGLESDLFVTTPTAILARKITDGRDPTIEGIPIAQFESDTDVHDYSTRVVVLADGSGSLIATGSADAASVPYVDGFANDVVRTRMVNEAETSAGNANSRAQLHLNRFAALRKALTISTKDFDVEGSFAVGDTVYVWDPTDEALVDITNEVRFRGAVLSPVKIRVLGQTFPITAGMSVYIRHGDATYTDVTDSVVFEEGETSLEVGANPRSLGGGEGGQILSGRVNTEPVPDDGSTPDVPVHANTPWGTASYLDNEGRTRARILVEWDTPLNTDASTITDGSHYTIRWRITGETEYQFSTVDFGTNKFLLQDLSPGVTYEISVAAVDRHNNSAGYGADESVVAQADTIAPSTPAAATVAGSPLALQISHDLGKASGGTFNLEADLDHLKVYVSTTSGFTPAEANRAGEIPATNANLTLGITVIKTFEILDTATRFVKVTAVDAAGNESGASAQASVTADLIDTAHITDALITTAKIDNLAVTNAKINDLNVNKLKAGTINAEIITLTGSAKLEIVQASGNIQLGSDVGPVVGYAGLSLSHSNFDNIFLRRNSDGVVFFRINDGGANALTFDSASGVLAVTGEIHANTGTLTTLTVDGTITLGTDGVLRTAPSGQRIEITGADQDRIRFFTGDSFEAIPGTTRAAVSGSGASRTLQTAVHAPTTTGDTNSMALIVRSESFDDSSFSPAIVASYGGGSSQTPQFRMETNIRLRLAEGTASEPGLAFVSDGKTGMYRSGTDEIALGSGGAEMFTGLNAATDEVRILPAFANAIASGDDHVGVTSTGLLRRQTSALKYKKFVARLDPRELANIDLDPARFKRRSTTTTRGERDDAWHVGLVADWLIDQDERLGRRDPNGKPENFNDRAVQAVLASKSIVAFEEITDLRTEIDELTTRLAELERAA